MVRRKEVADGCGVDEHVVQRHNWDCAEVEGSGALPLTNDIEVLQDKLCPSIKKPAHDQRPTRHCPLQARQ